MTNKEKAALLKVLEHLDHQVCLARFNRSPSSKYTRHETITALKDLLLPDRPPMDRYIERQTLADCEFVGCKKAKTCRNIRGKKLIAPCTGRIFK